MPSDRTNQPPDGTRGGHAEPPGDRTRPREDTDERGHIWVLDTQTKGTGANMVPLASLVRKPGRSDPVPGFVFRKLERSPEAPEPPAPYRFRVVDVMTREVLADDADARTAVQALEDMRSVVDVLVYVWEPDLGRWRMLTFGETEALWGFRGRVAQPG